MWPWTAGVVTLVGCTSPPLSIDDERVGEARAPITVEEAVTAGCSTSQIAGLSLQIIGQSNCIEPGAFSELSATSNATFGSAVLPFLEEPARDRLAEALAENAGTNMQINSMLRTVAQQYLLYRWYLAGTCGIGLAASPSNSNHETGLAIDIQQYDTWRTILEAKDFAWLGASDPVHFDYDGPGAIDHRDLGVLAFQQLWNLNNPGDLIDEDGIYGPQTEMRIEMSPAEGFSEGPTCGTVPGEGALTIGASFSDADDDFDDGPSNGVPDLFEGESYTLVVTVTNTGAAPVTAVSLSLSADDGLGLDNDTIAIGDVAPGTSTDTSVTVAANTYSVGDAPLSIDVSAAADVTAMVSADIYSQRRWEWDGERLEGWTAVGDGGVTLDDGALVIPAGGSARGPAIAVAAASVNAVSVEGSADAAATLIVGTDAGEQLFNLDLANGSAVVDLGEVSGTITSLRVDAASATHLAALRLEGDATIPGETPVEGADGCSCSLPGRVPARGWPGMLGWLGALALSRLASRPSRGASGRRRRRSP